MAHSVYLDFRNVELGIAQLLHSLNPARKYTFLKKNKNLTEEQKIARHELIQDYHILGEAYRLKELFDDFWDFKNPEEATAFFAYWSIKLYYRISTIFRVLLKTPDVIL